MLYHLERIDYQDDVYSVCENQEMRDLFKAVVSKIRTIFKIVGLVAINAKNEGKAYGGISEKLKKEE